MPSLSCGIKGRQQVIYLNQNRIASCCKAYPVTLDGDFQSMQVRWLEESRALEQGVRLPDCGYCWKEEDLGRTSYRMTFPAHTGLRIELVAENLCNHMCSYCNPKFSSMWQQSVSKFGSIKNVFASDVQNLMSPETQQHDPTQILQQIKDFILVSDEPVTLVLLGGEPLMQNRALAAFVDFDLIDKVTLEIITNLNPPSSRFLENLLDRFKDRPDHLRFSISIDATPAFNHVVRHGFDQERFYRCLDLVNRYGCSKTVLATTSVLSIMDLPEYIKWLTEVDLSAKFMPLNNPRSLQVANAPLIIRQDILSKLDHPPAFLSEQLSLPDVSKVDRHSCYQYLNQYFVRTGLDTNQITNKNFRRFWTEIDS